MQWWGVWLLIGWFYFGQIVLAQLMRWQRLVLRSNGGFLALLGKYLLLIILWPLVLMLSS